MILPGGEGADQPGDAHLTEIGIDLDLGEHGAMRPHGIACLSRRVGGALPLSLDFVKSGTTEDLGVAFAAALVVASEQAATARNHAGITGAEQRRAIVVGGKIGEARDHAGARLWIAVPAVAV